MEPDALRLKFNRDAAFRRAVLEKYRRCRAIELEIQQKTPGDPSLPALAREWKREHTEYKQMWVEAHCDSHSPEFHDGAQCSVSSGSLSGERGLAMERTGQHLDNSSAKQRTAPALLLEVAVLVICCSLALRNYSGPRTIFATVSFGVGMHLVVAAELTSPGSDNAETESQSAQLRPRLALLYACHWTADTLELVFGGHTATTAVTIATSMLKGRFELACLFVAVLAMLNAQRANASRSSVRKTLAWSMMGQAMLALRAYIVWRELLAMPPDSPWRQGGAEEYARVTFQGQVGGPILAAALALALTSSRRQRWAERVAGAATTPAKPAEQT